MKVDGFDWDGGNSFKSEAKHGLSREVIETFFQGRLRIGPDPRHSHAEERFLALGLSPLGRPMIVAFTFRLKAGLKLVRPISARYMHAKEVEEYGEAFTQNEE